MVGKVELFLNIVHYSIFKVDQKLHAFADKINPFLLIGEIPVVKKKFKEQGTSLKEVGDKIWANKRYGFGVLISGGGLTIIVFFILWTIFLTGNHILNYPFSFSWQPFGICIFLAYSFCHLLVFQNDKYLSYFKQFENKSVKEKRNYLIWSLAFAVSSICLFIYSFCFLPPTS